MKTTTFRSGLAGLADHMIIRIFSISSWISSAPHLNFSSLSPPAVGNLCPSFPTLPRLCPCIPPQSFPPSAYVSASATVFRHPVRVWVISGELIWPLMIGSGTCSSVSDWARDEEANFPWCSWRIVVALNYHLLCVWARVWVCAQTRAYVFINVWVRGRSWQLVDWQ